MILVPMTAERGKVDRATRVQGLQGVRRVSTWRGGNTRQMSRTEGVVCR